MPQYNKICLLVFIVLIIIIVVRVTFFTVSFTIPILSFIIFVDVIIISSSIPSRCSAKSNTFLAI